MAITEAPRFARAPQDPPPATVAAALAAHAALLNAHAWLYCGYAPLPAVDGLRPPAHDVTAGVDNMFRLSTAHGFERVPVVVTASLRSSRFAPILFWEVLHVLADGGTWIDIDLAERCEGTPLSAADFPLRPYFRECLQLDARAVDGTVAVHIYRKTSPAPLAATIDDRGWTFGILTSGESPRAGRMAADILALDLPGVEVIFCGPSPSNAPRDPRVRAIDLERPEPRGWITRKKNLIADAAAYDNLCILHDRFIVTPEWARALTGYGACYAVLTFPQVFTIDRERRFMQRYADYQVLDQARGLDEALAARVYAGAHVFYAAYDDFAETAFCCGGVYVARKCLWNRVRQDETLYHCEWEDITFGLACQRQGLPHRVNRDLTLESHTPHPMALTRIHDMPEPGVRLPGFLHVASAQAEAAARAPEAFVPVIGATRDAYYRRVADRFNRIPDAHGLGRLTVSDTGHCSGLSDFWGVIETRIADRMPRRRDTIAAVVHFLSDTIYNWPNCEALAAIRANERAGSALPDLDHVQQFIGWGTGAAFRSLHRRIGRRLEAVVDRTPARWGTRIEGVNVESPGWLANRNPTHTAVVVFSCFKDEITAAVREMGPFTVVMAEDLAGARTVHPLSGMVQHFAEVERYYPVLFTDSIRTAAVAA